MTQCVDIDQKVDLISRAGKCVNILYSGGVCLIRYDRQANSAAGVSFLQSFVSICWLALSSEAKSIHMLKFVCALDFLFFLMIHGKSRHTWLTWTFWLIHNVARIPETNTFISFCKIQKDEVELPEDPVDGGDGGDGGRVTHPLGEQLLPDLPSKHP